MSTAGAPHTDPTSPVETGRRAVDHRRTPARGLNRNKYPAATYAVPSTPRHQSPVPTSERSGRIFIQAVQRPTRCFFVSLSAKQTEYIPDDMKHFLVLALTALLFFTSAPAKCRSTEAARAVMERATGQTDLPVKLSLRESDSTYFAYEVKGGVLRLEGSSGAALCRGFYDYLKRHRGGVCTWSGRNLRLPARMADEGKRRVVSPFAHHYYMNVVTFGYSAPYWDWERWQQEIDWMALHGIDMPLALTAYEAIIARVWRQMGLTDAEINAYFVGPAHLPWMRMGNISGIDGPLDNDWHERQVALQHQILDRMRALGMNPICPAFAGFVPQAIQRISPATKLVTTHWAGSFRNWMIAPTDPLFRQIGTAFIREWEKEFGPCKYYLADSFNEMEIPFPPKDSPERYEQLAHYGESVYQAIAAASPDAVWAMQGWMFGYQRDIWDYATLEALLKRVPNDRMLLLDLAVDYNTQFWHSQVNWEYYKGFFDKPWVYSVIPNMGGKTGMTGVLEFYANGHLAALTSPHRGRLVGHGMAPEGIENNEVIYELIADAGWSADSIDLRTWLAEYSAGRYGACPEEVQRYWDLLLRSVYGTFTDHPRNNWQFRPGLVQKGSINLSPDYFHAIESFAEAKELDGSPLYRTDLTELAALYAGGKAEMLVRHIDRAYLAGDTTKAQRLQERFASTLRAIDSLLSCHPTLRLDRWLGFARRAARTPEQLKQYTRNARRLVTIWGPPVDDYSARMWSGLIGDYYLPRWQHYFEARTTGKTFDFAVWEKAWVERGSQPLPPAPTDIDTLRLARRLIHATRGISEETTDAGTLGRWTTDAAGTHVLNFPLTIAQVRRLKGVTLHTQSDGTHVDMTQVEILVDGKSVARVDLTNKATPEDTPTLPDLSDTSGGNNGCTLRLTVRTDRATTGSVRATY